MLRDDFYVRSKGRELISIGKKTNVRYSTNVRFWTKIEFSNDVVKCR